MFKKLSLALFLILFIVSSAFAGALFTYPKFQAYDSNGDPLSGGKLYTYAPGTTTNKATYSDRALTTPNANPLILDSRGEGVVYGAGQYKFVLKDADDNLIWTFDDVDGLGGYLGGNYYFPDASQADQGVAVGSVTVKDFVDSIAVVAQATIVLSRGSTGNITDYTFLTSETIPSNITLKFELGARASIAVGETLTINGPFEAGLYQVFTGAGSIAFGNLVTEVYPEWWGIDSANDELQLDAADTALTNGTIVLKQNYSYAIDNDVTIDNPLEIKKGAICDVANTKTLTINGPFEAGLYQVFSGSGSVDLTNARIPVIYPEWFADIEYWQSAGTPGTDASPAIQKAASHGKKVILSAPDYRASTTFIIPLGVTLEGIADRTTIRVDAGATLTQNYVCLVNSTNGLNWTTGYVGPVQGMYNIHIRGGAATQKGWFVAASIDMRNLAWTGLATGIQTTTDYLDHFSIDRAIASNPQGTTYQIRLGRLGDGVNISNVILAGNAKAIYMESCLSADLTNIVGGTEYYFKYCMSVKIGTLHTEGGWLVSENSNISLRDSCIWKKNTATQFLIEIKGGGRNHTTLDNVMIVYAFDARPTNYLDYDIKLGNNGHLSLRNVYRRVSSHSTDYSLNYIHGIRIADTNGVGVDEFNKYSYILSQKSDFTLNSSELRLVDGFSVNVGTGSPYFLGTTTTSGFTKWQIASDTYYYRAQLLWDIDHAIGVGDAGGEDNVALTNGGNGALLIATFATPRSEPGFVRFYRGTATGSYDKYVDVPTIAGYQFFDDGERVNGFEWQGRTAGAVDSMNTNISRFKKLGGLTEAFAAAAPTQGSWTREDTIWYPPTAGAAPGSRCTESGTFGAATDNTGDTDGSTAVITGMADTSDFAVGSYVDVSAGFPTTGPYKILSKTTTTITIEVNSDAAQVNITVDTSDPVFKAMANLAA